jgi:hypothetical protein
MRSVADGSSASGLSVNGRSRLTEARCHSGLLAGSRGCHREAMTECCQRFREAGEIEGAMASRDRQRQKEELTLVELVETTAKRGQRCSTRICTTLAHPTVVA